MPQTINVYTREELRTLTEPEFESYENAIAAHKNLISAVKTYRSAPEQVEQPQE